MTTRRLLQTAACFAALAIPRGVRAQNTTMGGGSGDIAMGYCNLPTKSSRDNQNGLRLSETTILHAGLGVEAGYDSNVFYGDKGDQVVGSPLIMVTPYLGLTNATRTGAVPTGVYFDLEVDAPYRHYLSDAQQPVAPNNMGITTSNRKVSDQPGFLPTANGMLEFSSGQTFSFALQDLFARFQDAPYIGAADPGSSIIHYTNDASAQLRWSPGGGRLQGVFRYANHYDAFNADSGYSFADSVTHTVSVDASWKWLPKTALFVSASQGYVSYLNQQPAPTVAGMPTAQDDFIKHSSYPLHLLAGLRGLITRKTSVNLYAGYANAFYSGINSQNPEGLAGHISANAEVTVSPTTLNALGLGYHHDFQNAIVGNYYNVDAVTAWFQQQVAGRLVLSLTGRYEHRDYHFSLGTRTDNFVQAGGTIDYHPKSWTFLGVGYALLLNQAGTGTNPDTPIGASYTKHQIFARAGVTY